ncbi:hAT family dimerization domain containing protein [Panicum miliaceum]|uniref:HAT family dimerization domain containing protein n=1 Tax=Panicum miliaceum TaxID=4540 RepID=A0A3L6PF35_PANMI|nr:hAT family dimerization domain containing protein [Panicum miliaceum]
MTFESRSCLLRVRNRNHESGAQKHKRQRRVEQVVQSQKGAIDRFVVRESPARTEHQTLHSDGDGNHRDNTDNVEVHTSVVDSGD